MVLHSQVDKPDLCGIAPDVLFDWSSLDLRRTDRQHYGSSRNARIAAGDAPIANIDNLVAASKQLYPNEHVLSLGWDDDKPRVFLNMAPSFEPKPDEDHSLIFDAQTSKLLEQLNGNTVCNDKQAVASADDIKGVDFSLPGGGRRAIPPTQLWRVPVRFLTERERDVVDIRNISG